MKMFRSSSKTLKNLQSREKLQDWAPPTPPHTDHSKTSAVRVSAALNFSAPFLELKLISFIFDLAQTCTTLLRFCPIGESSDNGNPTNTKRKKTSRNYVETRNKCGHERRKIRAGTNRRRFSSSVCQDVTAEKKRTANMKTRMQAAKTEPDSVCSWEKRPMCLVLFVASSVIEPKKLCRFGSKLKWKKHFSCLKKLLS